MAGALGMMAEGGSATEHYRMRPRDPDAEPRYYKDRDRRYDADADADAGRFGDTMLAHVSPDEAALLELLGGAGTTNPETGLPEYFNWKKLLRVAGPVVSAFVPGALGMSGMSGALLGAGLGAGSAKLAGAGPMQTLLSGAGAGLGGYHGIEAGDWWNKGKDFVSTAFSPSVAGSAGAGLSPYIGDPSELYRAQSGMDAALSPYIGDPSELYRAQSGMDAAASLSLLDKAGAIAKEYPGTTAAGALLALSALGGMGDDEQQGALPPLQQGATGKTFPNTTRFNRTRRPDPGDFYTYGERPQPSGGSFFEDNFADSGASVGAADGGHFVEGPGGGRDDTIPARLSDGEYVMDAETVSLLGDGSNDAGAAKLDALRERIRMHKGQMLAQGKISPDALDAGAYVEGVE